MDSGSDPTSRWEYIDFELEIHKGSHRRYSVSVRSPAGEAQEQMRFPFDKWELENRLLALENTLLRFGGSRRRIPSQEEQAVQEFGQSLLQALLVGEVRTRYEVSLLEARRQNKGLRLKLRIQPPELARLPWEFLYDPDHDEYLSLSDKTPLVRYVDLHRPIEQLPVTPPLRILGMVASPQDLPELDVEHEKRLVEQALRTLRASRLVELSWLEGQTWEDLQQAMWGGPWHIFHFIGHGVFNQASDEGCIALSDEEGRSRLLGARNLARLLDGHYPLRLVLLNSCEGARGSARDAFSGAAATLVRRGIPAVVAMQYRSPMRQRSPSLGLSIEPWQMTCRWMRRWLRGAPRLVWTMRLSGGRRFCTCAHPTGVYSTFLLKCHLLGLAESNPKIGKRKSVGTG